VKAGSQNILIAKTGSVSRKTPNTFKKSKKLCNVHIERTIETCLFDLARQNASNRLFSFQKHENWKTNENNTLLSKLRRDAAKLEMIWAINLFKLV
jgi:hypothetical protein